jgi:hypothetical protein
MSIETLFLIGLIIFILLALPAWPYSKEWGYKPISVLSLCLIVFLIWVILGERPLFRRSLGDDIRSAGQEVSDSLQDIVR